MASDATGADGPISGHITGRCYCGAFRFNAPAPQTVSYCHCSDCRHWTGAPVAAFAAFASGEVRFDPPLGPGLSVAPGVRRWACARCGSPLAATFDYLPDQVYVPVGLADQPELLPPQLHSHAQGQLPWLHLTDNLPREAASARDSLSDARPNS